MKSMILKKLIFLLVFLSGSMMFAQITVTGVASDANGPVPGINVIVKGTTNGASTDFDGQYTIDNVAEDAILVFSYVGFQTQEVAVNGRTTINVTMVEDAAELEAVVVIGYGTQSVKDATGAVAVVSTEDFNQGVIASPEQLIQGKTAGVQITQTSGEPGAGINLRIRGTSSVRSNNNPLFVVDGIPLAGDETGSSGSNIGVGSSASRNPLNFISPNDIESVSILKDASATAIYGSRGANGVVIITTKSGRGSAKPKFEFSSNLSIASPAEEFDLLDRDQYLSAIQSFGGDVAAQDFGNNTDWQDVITRKTASQNQNLSYSQSYKNGNIRASFGYGKQFGVVEKSSLERITGRINAAHRFFNEKLKVNVQGTISRVNDEAPPIGADAGFQGDLLGTAYIANPTWPADPGFDPGGSFVNPLNLLRNSQSETKTNRILLNGSIEYEIIEGLSAKLNLGYDDSESTRGSAISGDVIGLQNGTPGNGRATVNDIDVTNRLLEFTINYEKQFENSTFSILGGYSFQDFERSGRNIGGFGFNTTSLDGMIDGLEASANAIENNIQGPYQQYIVSDKIRDGDGTIAGAFINRIVPVVEGRVPFTAPGGLIASTITADTFDNKDELQSYFVRANYTIADKYIFTATMRADGSSRFGENNKYGYFPSGAVAWKIDQEDFSPDAFSTLKLRLGYGITGNQDGLGFGNFVRRERFVAPVNWIENGGEVVVPGTSDVSFENPDLKWEETSQLNVGIDFGFMNDRLQGTIDVYRKDTKDLLLRVRSAQPAAQPFTFSNVDGNVINQGVEFAIDYDIIQQEDLNWNFGFNIAYNKNELQDFEGQFEAGTIFGQGLTGAFSQILTEGEPLFSYFLREFQGFDENGQSITANNDLQVLVGKSALPDFNVGISTSFDYKNWDASVFFAGQFGHYIYNNTQNAFFTAGSIQGGRNVTTDVIGNGEAGTNAADVSTRFLEKGDFLRLQNATIGYNVPLKGDGVFKTLRLFATGQNLFVITDYSGLDPEVSTTPTDDSNNLLNNLPTAGIDYTAFPRPRTYTFGLNATF
ncbi:TonB-dependent receptor [Aquimarina sp. MMG016]|uniref:SusC/RagA family TonB-linked outer membrane protein n=1 Tax=Aquimarina sp. MMG016 TaxID=2822690 RepID=UPI001B3A48C7|nr:TonB-dependent receptor [Aquimarina sp. MMG016]MBQ4820826.1 TonB-dependent receptor [Aquimarina sp. MMG016]